MLILSFENQYNKFKSFTTKKPYNFMNINLIIQKLESLTGH
jgi:hypothetical protein